MSQSLRECMSGVSKPFQVVSHWHCGPSDTKAGKVARATCGISTLLMIPSIIMGLTAMGFIFREVRDEEHECFPDPYQEPNKGERVFRTICGPKGSYKRDMILGWSGLCIFTLALFGYFVVTPIIGHRCCGAIDLVYGNRNIAATDVEQLTRQEGHALLNINSTSNDTPPPSYIEVMRSQQISAVSPDYTN